MIVEKARKIIVFSVFKKMHWSLPAILIKKGIYSMENMSLKVFGDSVWYCLERSCSTTKELELRTDIIIVWGYADRDIDEE